MHAYDYLTKASHSKTYLQTHSLQNNAESRCRPKCLHYVLRHLHIPFRDLYSAILRQYLTILAAR